MVSMAQNKFILPFIFLALIICLEFHSIEGRLLKSEEGVHGQLPNSNSNQKETVNVEKHEDDVVQVDVPTNVATTVASVSPPTVPGAPVSLNVPPAPGHDVDGFRPTTPGHSPGVGHSVDD